MTGQEKSDICFGGPDLPPRQLRNLLEERVRAVPTGGSIDWVTYYFRDRLLARALLDARNRGVRVRVVIDPCPRMAHANQRVITMLSGADGLGDGLQTPALSPSLRLPGLAWKPHLHEKLYCFSRPDPIAFVGSFNPSGDMPEEEPEILKEIADQDRGHNVLVGIREPELVQALVRHARWYHDKRGCLHVWTKPAGGTLVRSGNTEIYFLPCFGWHPVVRLLDRLGSGARLRMAASHLRGPAVLGALLRLARRGAAIEILAEATLRRVSTRAEQRVRNAGISFRRLRYPDGLPMHNKFLLVEDGQFHKVVFGSFNWTTSSFWVDREICVICEDSELFRTFEERWAKMSAQ